MPGTRWFGVVCTHTMAAPDLTAQAAEVSLTRARHASAAFTQAVCASFQHEPRNLCNSSDTPGRALSRSEVGDVTAARSRVRHACSAVAVSAGGPAATTLACSADSVPARGSTVPQLACPGCVCHRMLCIHIVHWPRGDFVTVARRVCHSEAPAAVGTPRHRYYRTAVLQHYSQVAAAAA